MTDVPLLNAYRMPEEFTVYIVDDDEAVRESLAVFFDSIGIETRTFSSGNEFLNASIPSNSGCVFLDLAMPGMNGIDVLEHLQTFRSGNPVIVITADIAPETKRRALTVGASDVIEKPFLARELLDAMHRALGDG